MFDMSKVTYRRWIDALFSLRNSPSAEVRLGAYGLIGDITAVPSEDWGAHFSRIEKDPCDLFERMLVRQFRLTALKKV